MSLWRPVALAAGVAAYALLSHRLMLHHAAAPWAVAVLFGPLLAACAGWAWHERSAAALAGCAAAVAVLAGVVLRGGVDDANRLYVLQHAAIHLALAGSFASTLRPGHTPLITQLAERVHRRFTPAMRAYTGWLTRLWVGYFVAMVAVSAAVYALAPWPWWSAFCNFATPVAALALFVGEHVVRYRRHPEFERVSMALAWQSYRERGAAGAAVADAGDAGGGGAGNAVAGGAVAGPDAAAATRAQAGAASPRGGLGAR